MLACRGR